MTDTKNRNRQPAGAPVGGEYATEVGASTGVQLGVNPPGDKPRTARQAVPGTPRGGVTTLVSTSIVQLEDDRLERDFVVKRSKIVMGGEPARRAEALAVARRLADRERTVGVLETLASKSKSAVTLLMQSRAGDVETREGTLVRDHDGRFILLDKGTRSGNGIYLDVDRVLSARPGYGGAQALAEDWNRHAATMPRVDEVNRSVVNELVPEGYDGAREEVAAAFVFTHPGFGSEDGRGCVFLATDRDPADVVNGYFIAPGDSGLTSEHGSFRIDDLAKWGGIAPDYVPASLTFRQAMDLGDRARQDPTIALEVLAGTATLEGARRA